jgi:hypothetical protein
VSLVSWIPLAAVTATFWLALGSILIALAALAVNATGVIRRPRIVPFWLPDLHGREGLYITVTGRRRAVQVTELGVLYYPRTWRRQFLAEQLLRRDAICEAIDLRDGWLQDGQTVTRWLAVDRAVEENLPEVEGGVEYCFAVASGKVYLMPAHSRVREWLGKRGTREFHSVQQAQEKVGDA